MTNWCDGIWQDYADWNVHALADALTIDMRDTQLAVGAPDRSGAKEIMWYDYMIRAADWFAGSVAAWDRQNNLIPGEGIDKLTTWGGRYWSGAQPLLQAPSVSARDHLVRSLAIYRFALSFCDVEELLASKGVIVSYEAVRLWCGKFGPEFARRLRPCRRRLGRRWHVDEGFHCEVLKERGTG